MNENDVIAGATAAVGQTPRRFQSGEVDYDGHISRRGDKALRSALYEAAAVILNRSGSAGTIVISTICHRLVVPSGSG